MAQLTPQQAADKWARRTSGAVQDYSAGISRVSVSPMEVAAEYPERYQDGVNRAVAEGRYQSGLRRVSLQGWKDAAVNKGAQRIPGGVQAAQGKMQSFLAEFLPYEDSIAQQVNSMPKGGVENGIARAVAQIRGNAAFRRTR
jgi:hypothetical protein